MNDLKLSALRAANEARLPTFRDRQGRLCHHEVPGQPPGFDWALSQWSNALCGELGEAANLIKKIERGDMTLDEARVDLADELADVLTYLDLLAHRAGINLADATIRKFNRVSARVSSPVRLQGEQPREFAPLGCDCYPGCWGDHSAEWPTIQFATAVEARVARDIIVREKLVPYGSMVSVGKDESTVRFASDAHVTAVLARLGRT